MHLARLLADPTLPWGSALQLQPLQQPPGPWILSPRLRTFGSVVQHLLPHPTRHPQFGHAHHLGPRSLHQIPMTNCPLSLLATLFANLPAESVECSITPSANWPMRGERPAILTSLPEDTSAT